MGIITWGIGITRTELDAHHCRTFLRRMSVQKSTLSLKCKSGLILQNQPDIYKTSLNVAKIQV